jgi:hypothetical protein
MTTRQAVAAYLTAYAARNLPAIEPLLADAISLRDWQIRVVGKPAALAETQKNFDAVRHLAIEILAIYERPNGIAAELKIDVEPRDGEPVTIHVVDVFEFDDEGRIRAIRAYLGRDDEG